MLLELLHAVGKQHVYASGTLVPDPFGACFAFLVYVLGAFILKNG